MKNFLTKTFIGLLIFLPQLIFSQTKSGWEMETKSRENYNSPTMANGQIGLICSPTPLKVNRIVLNGVFDKFGDDNVQCILPGINCLNLEIRTPNGRSTNANSINNWSQKLNMKEGMLQTQFNIAEDITVNHEICALQHLSFSALAKIEIEALRDVEIKIINAHAIESPLKNGSGFFRTIANKNVKIPVLTSCAKSPKDKHLISASSGYIFESNPCTVLYNEWSENSYQQYFILSLKKGEKYKFSLVGSIVSTADFQDPQTESERQCIFAILERTEKLINNHKKAWDEIWQTDIEIEGDPQSQLDVRFALFNLYTSIRKNSKYSIPPMGLTNLDYYGHIFWDSELWMYPSLLALNPELAKSMIDYRLGNLEGARKKAIANGFKGVMFPWESDDKGEESCPTWALSGPFEHHITAVVGIALWNYYCITQDKEWLESKGFPVVKEIADFWVSRSTVDNKGKYHILNVVGADEYAENVDDDAFTNGAVIKVLQYVNEAALLLKKPIDPSWKKISDNLVLHKFDNGVIKDYQTYDGQVTKQADVNLLSYPLGIVTDTLVMLKNLNYYHQKDDPAGPAMTHSISSIIYSKLGKKAKAWEYFLKAYRPNQRTPYGVLAEGVYDNNPYFMTAAGGMLQAIIFGFCNAEITSKGVAFGKPRIPINWKSVTLKGFGSKKETLKITNQ